MLKTWGHYEQLVRELTAYFNSDQQCNKDAQIKKMFLYFVKIFTITKNMSHENGGS
jgi:hypothetical protein